MYLSSGDIVEMDAVRLKTFLENKIPEGMHLDYKEGLSGKSDKESKREFLKDITAFANAHGGDLLIGVKEPAENIYAEQQIVGIEDGEAMSQNLERLASSSVDPRIPGLRIRAIPVNNGRSCLVVHVPPSLSRPHMVQHMGHRSFYIRHSESSFPMTTHEIRQSVMASLSAEDRVRNYLGRRESEVKKYYMRQAEPLFLLEAIPLIEPEQGWDMSDGNLVEVLRGASRFNKYNHYCSLCSNAVPRPTIDGLMGRDKREDTKWFTEIHRNGYVSVAYRNAKREKLGEKEVYVVHSGYCHLFCAFADLMKEILSITGSDLPYVISSKYFNAKSTVLWTESIHRRDFSESLGREEILWPVHIRQVGQDPMEIAEELCLEMFNAFGLDSVTD